MRRVDRIGDAVHVDVAHAMRLVQRRAAGHDDVGQAHQLRLAALHDVVVGRDRRAVVAVVDHAARAQRLDQRERGGRVDPDEGRDDGALAHEPGEQRGHGRELVVVEAAGVAARVRHQQLDAACHLGALDVGVLVRRQRRLDVVDAVMHCKPGQQLLRSLPVEVPALRREHHQRRSSRRKFPWRTRGAARQGGRSGEVHGPAPGALRRGNKLSMLLRLAAKPWRGRVDGMTRNGRQMACRSAT